MFCPGHMCPLQYFLFSGPIGSERNRDEVAAQCLPSNLGGLGPYGMEGSCHVVVPRSEVPAPPPHTHTWSTTFAGYRPAPAQCTSSLRPVPMTTTYGLSIVFPYYIHQVGLHKHAIIAGCRCRMPPPPSRAPHMVGGPVTPLYPPPPPVTINPSTPLSCKKTFFACRRVACRCPFLFWGVAMRNTRAAHDRHIYDLFS